MKVKQMNKEKIEWIFLGAITLLLIIIIIPSSKADEFMHEININSSGDTEIKIMINVTEEPVTNYYTYKEVKGDSEKILKSLINSLEIDNSKLSISDLQYKFRSSLWNFILARLYPYFSYVNTEIDSCKQYNIDNEQRIFDLQKRVFELETKQNQNETW